MNPFIATDLIPSTNLDIVLIGAGNLSTRISHPLQNAGCSIVQVISNSEASSKKLARELNASYSYTIKELNNDADIYIIAVPDSEIISVANSLSLQDKLVIHTSGGTDMDILKDTSNNYGVIWPVQTLLKDRETDMSKVPLCIEGNNDNSLAVIKKIAGLLSNEIHELSSQHRILVHTAAAFACNFSNHMYVIAKNLLEEESIPFSILYPSIIETASNVEKHDPEKGQTGPAVRKDEQTMEEHLKVLKDHPVYQKIYTLVSQSISNDTADE